MRIPDSRGFILYGTVVFERILLTVNYPFILVYTLTLSAPSSLYASTSTHSAKITNDNDERCAHQQRTRAFFGRVS